MKKKILVALLTVIIFSNLSGCAVKDSVRSKMKNTLNKINFLHKDKDNKKNDDKEKKENSESTSFSNSQSGKIKDKDAKTYSNKEYTFDYPKSYTEKKDEKYENYELVLANEKENIIIGVESTPLNGRTEDAYFEFYFEGMKSAVNPDIWNKDKKNINGYNAWCLTYSRTNKKGDDLKKVYVNQTMFFLNQKAYIFTCLSDSDEKKVSEEYENIINSVSFHL